MKIEFMKDVAAGVVGIVETEEGKTFKIEELVRAT